MEPNTEDKSEAAREMCEKGLWPEVLAFAQKWNKAAPSDHRALHYIGLGLSGMGQFAMAETAYRQALMIDATDINVWNSLALLLYERMRRPAAGVRCLEQALKLNPNHGSGWSNLATMAGKMGRHQQALEYADRALALDPRLVEAYLHKATAARALKKMDVVREVCNALASLAPENFHRAR